MEKDVSINQIEVNKPKRILKLKKNNKIISLDYLKKNTVQFKLNDKVAPHYFRLDSMEYEFDSYYPAAHKLTLEFREVWHGTKQ